MLEENQIRILLSVFFIVLVVGFLLLPVQFSSGSLPGHFFGVSGTVVMALTLVYPFRKRIQGKKGRKNPLNTHILYGLVGPSLVVLHSGHNLASFIGNISFVLMVTVVLSGITGRYLYGKVKRGLKEQTRDLEALKDVFHSRKKELGAAYCLAYFGKENGVSPDSSGHFAHGEGDLTEEAERCESLRDLAQSIATAEHTIEAFSATRALFSTWSRVHIYLTCLLFALVLVHVATSLYYGLKWLP